MSPRAGSLWTLTLRELLAFVGLAGVACVTLKFASDWLWIGLSSAVILLGMAILIVAAIDRGPRQAFAAGFVLAAGTYLTVLLISELRNGRELDPYSASLPTSRLMLPVFQAVVLQEYTVNTSSGVTHRFPTWAEAEAFRVTVGNPAPAPGAFGGVGLLNSVNGSETPMRQDFMPIAHLWWTLLLGYLGGRFARYVYQRREALQSV